MAGMTLAELQEQLAGLEPYQRKTDDELRAQAESVYNPMYERSLANLQKNIEQNVAAQNRSALDSGMQRSSYNAAQQAMIRSKGLDTRADIDAQYAGNVANTLLNLIQSEDQKQQAADNNRNQLLMALYEYGKKGSGSGEKKEEPTTNNNANGLPFDLSGVAAKSINGSLSLRGNNVGTGAASVAAPLTVGNVLGITPTTSESMKYFNPKLATANSKFKK